MADGPDGHFTERQPHKLVKTRQRLDRGQVVIQDVCLYCNKPLADIRCDNEPFEWPAGHTTEGPE